jgi:target of rapamycin complex subunit LST8
MSVIATTSSDKTVKLWNTTTWELEKTLVGHQKWVWDAVFSADSVYLVTASSDRSGKLWHLKATGDIKPGDEVVRNFTGHTFAVTCVAMNDSAV